MEDDLVQGKSMQNSLFSHLFLFSIICTHNQLFDFTNSFFWHIYSIYSIDQPLEIASSHISLLIWLLVLAMSIRYAHILYNVFKCARAQHVKLDIKKGKNKGRRIFPLRMIAQC